MKHSEYLILVESTVTPGQQWKEKIVVPEGQDPLTVARAIVAEFNAEERRRHKAYPKTYPLDQLRKVVEIVGTTDRGTFVYCKPKKITQGFTIDTLYICNACGLYYNHTGIGGLPTDKFVCDKSRVCTECNKLFPSVKELRAHKKADVHEAPSWLKQLRGESNE